MMSEREYGGECRTTILYVDDYDGEILSGRLCNPGLSEAEPFHGVMSFLTKMEALLNQMCLPQSFVAVRSFSRTRPGERELGTQLPEPAPREGRRATFAVHIHFRQNASWQGCVTWLERNRVEHFRSVLELLMLIHSALNGEEPKCATG
jgi:hypothetical protein